MNSIGWVTLLKLRLYYLPFLGKYIYKHLHMAIKPKRIMIVFEPIIFLIWVMSHMDFNFLGNSIMYRWFALQASFCFILTVNILVEKRLGKCCWRQQQQRRREKNGPTSNIHQMQLLFRMLWHLSNQCFTICRWNDKNKM